jgi:hypothetical protein
MDGSVGPKLFKETFMKGFIESKYIVSLECSNGEKEFSSKIPYSKILLYLPEAIASNLTIGTVKKIILPKHQKIIQFTVIELAALKHRPSSFCFHGDDHTKFIKVKGELLEWRKNNSAHS